MNKNIHQDYTFYSYKDLNETLNTIDKEKYLDNYIALISELNNRDLTIYNGDVSKEHIPFIESFYLSLSSENYQYSPLESWSVEELEKALKFDFISESDSAYQINYIIQYLSKKCRNRLMGKDFEKLLTKEKEAKESRKYVLIFWPLAILFALFFGMFPTNSGLIYLDEDPGFFMIILIVFCGVGFYIYQKRE
ncbi:hypothetical protein [Thalassotalea aquiviva]|uniref:hypothetical protein n=1 Tax=Thalassotalea aquiviva TaxID=3242415 RepID=UPI00352A3A52